MRHLLKIAGAIYSIFVIYSVGYYIGYYDRITSTVVQEKAFAKVVDEVLAYSGPFAQLIVSGNDCTLNNILVIGKNLKSGVSIQGENAVLKDSAFYIKDSK